MKPDPEVYDATTRKLFGFMASLNTHDLYSDMNFPTGYALPQDTRRHVSRLAAERGSIFSENTYLNGRASELIALATYSTYTILKNEFNKHDDLSSDERYAIGTHPITAETIALLSLRKDGAMRTIMMDQPRAPKDKSNYSINLDEMYLEASPSLKPEQSGCPFAGHEGTLKPDPLFLRAVRTIGSLAVICYDTHDK